MPKSQSADRLPRLYVNIQSTREILRSLAERVAMASILLSAVSNISIGGDRETIVVSVDRPERFINGNDEPLWEKSGGIRTSTLDATKEQIEQAGTGVGKIYCEAITGYSDVRDNLHETSVCFFYDFSVKDFYLCAEKGANYHT